MTSRIILLICVNILISRSICDDVLHSSTNSFGKYYVVLKDMIKCNNESGKIHEGLFNTYEAKIEGVNDYQNISGYLFTAEDYVLKQVKVSTSVWKNGDFRPMLTKIIDNPCKDEYALKLIKISTNADSSCSIKKGNFSTSINNPNEITHKLFGNYFFYSKVKTRVEYHSAKGITFCITVVTDTKPLYAKVYNNNTKTQ